MIKRIHLFIMALFALIVSVHAQNLTGKVIDEKNEPLAYANVILQTEDSVFLAGTTTDLEGKFELVLHEKAKYINFSFVGYTSVVKEIIQNNLGEIQLLPDAQLLGEVVVKGYLPKTQAKGDAMAYSDFYFLNVFLASITEFQINSLSAQLRTQTTSEG